MSEGKILNQIRKLRFLNGEMTQAELAEKVGVTRQTINALEAAKYSPSLELAFKISNEFNKPIGDVFRYEI